MQRFRNDHNTEYSPALYDEATVREVLARAAEIEVQSDSELLTARQIETLGNELGLSQEAVRRALGEKAGARDRGYGAPGTYRQRALSPLTLEQMNDAYSLNFWYALMCFPIVFALTRLIQSGTMRIMQSSTQPNGVGSALIIATAFLVPVALAYRSGHLIRRAGPGAIGGATSVFMVSMISLLATLAAAPRSNLGITGMLMLSSIFLGALAGALGANGRHWWENLPQNSDR